MDLTDRLAAERRGRLAAERLLELKSRELFEANRKLSQHALSLSGQIIEQRGETERLKEHTAQVQADLQRAEHHVEVVERRLWDSVETITDGFAVFDAEDRLIAANTAWLSIYGYSEHIGPGTLYLEVLRIAIDEGYVDLQGSAPGAWIGSMLERWDALTPTEPLEMLLTSGQWYRLVDRRSRDGDMVCLAQNITGLKERERELKEASHRAEAANRAKSAFLANMSHELRTPMNGVVAMAEMLLETEMEDEQRLYVSTIKSSGEALLEIINHVLDFSKMEAERLVLRPEAFDLERLLHEVVTLLGPTARDKNLGLHVDYDLFSPTWLVGDAMRIRQIMINLVGNAVKFTESGHVLIRVIGYEATEGGWSLHITVEDTGIGIPADMQEHIFGSFAQVESEKNRKFEGTGLGLAITRELVVLMNGDIWVESEPGEGACFGFRITLAAAEPVETLLPRVDTTIGQALVVAPEGHEAIILCRQLAQLGLDVAHATSGSEALKMVQSDVRPQITVIDDSLTDTTGCALAAALQEAHCRSARLLVCNANQDAARAMAQSPDSAPPKGIHAVLTRPMLRRDLFEAMARLPDVTASSAPDAPSSDAPPAETTAPGTGVADAQSPDAPLPDTSAPDMPAAAATVPETPVLEPAAEVASAQEPAAVDPPAVEHLAPVAGLGAASMAEAVTGVDPSGKPGTGTPADVMASHPPHASPPPLAEESTPPAPRPEAVTPAPPLADADAPGAPPPAESVPAEIAEQSQAQLSPPDGRGGPDHASITRIPTASTPPEPSAVPVPPGTPAAAPAPSGDASPRPMRVLAAEDNKTNRFVLDKLLAPLQIDLHFAVDGQDAVEKHAELHPDLILMDISMPRLDGKDAARAIRAHEAETGDTGSRRVPIVAMTAHALQGDKEEILASGIDLYMTKPLKRAQVTAHILEHCPAHCLNPQGDAALSAV
ncbi:MAG: ATP-binding protein [Pseudomonadota bacterium]